MDFFHRQYRAWLAHCLHQYNCAFGENRLYYCIPDPIPEDYCPSQLVEFSESGDAYPHGLGGTNWIPKMATPWERSEFFVS